MKIMIGMDVEFMAVKGGRYLYPILNNTLHFPGCDEFGHCVEIRPLQAETKEELMYNIMKEMAKLPHKVRYFAENASIISEADFNELLKAQGSKDIPTCRNIYGDDILKRTEFEKKALSKDKKVVYCGMHVHVSTQIHHTKFSPACEECGHTKEETDIIHVPIPYRILTRIFDDFLFNSLKTDENFDIGRYRSSGFYETKSISHFEYRSLGASAFTPKRVGIIFDMVRYIVSNYDSLCHYGSSPMLSHLQEMANELRKTKPYSGNLKKLWVKWL